MEDIALGYQSGFQARTAPSQAMKVIQGGFDEGMWLHDRSASSDEEIEIWNARLEQLSLRHPWLKVFIWEVNPKQKPRLVQSSVGYPKEPPPPKIFE